MLKSLSKLLFFTVTMTCCAACSMAASFGHYPLAVLFVALAGSAWFALALLSN